MSAGVPLYKRQVGVLHYRCDVPAAHQIAYRYDPSMTPVLEFHSLGSDSVAFREVNNRRSVMHGLLVFDQARAVVRLTGLANWTPLVWICALITVGLLDWRGWVLVLGLAVPLAYGYVRQARRYAQVLGAAVEEWSGSNPAYEPPGG